MKKKSGEQRFCFEGRKLNSVAKRDAYPPPYVDSILIKLRDAQFLSSVDLRKAFWQIPLENWSCQKTAFVLPGRGLFEFVVMPFGLHNAAQSQQRLVDTILGTDLLPEVFVYLNDVIIATSLFNRHLEVLREVSKRLKGGKLTANLAKCVFCLP